MNPTWKVLEQVVACHVVNAKQLLIVECDQQKTRRDSKCFIFECLITNVPLA